MDQLDANLTALREAVGRCTIKSVQNADLLESNATQHATGDLVEDAPAVSMPSSPAPRSWLARLFGL